MLTLSLSERLAALRETANTSARSSSNNPTPLSVYLTIYNKARDISGTINGDCYKNYMEGAKLLRDWLAPIDLAEVELSACRPLSARSIPAIVHSYEVHKIADVLVPAPISSSLEFYQCLARRNKLTSAIIYLSLKEFCNDYEDCKQ